MPSPGSVRQVAGVWKCADGGSCTGREAVNRRRTPSAFGRADTGTVQSVVVSRADSPSVVSSFMRKLLVPDQRHRGEPEHTRDTRAHGTVVKSLLWLASRGARIPVLYCTVYGTVPKFSPLSPCLSSRCSPGRRSTPSTPLVFFVEHARRRPQSTDSRQRSAWHCWDEHVLGVPRPCFGPCFFSRSIAATACPRR